MLKKAQVTIFIIVGLLILFVFLALMFITAKFQREQLEEQREQIVTGVIKKEALRLYVEDCLFDALEDGLALLGSQGRIWHDQPGGRKEFIEGRTGVTYNDERVFYGLIRTDYLNSRAYPCADESNSPSFCLYSYPQDAKFGQLELKWSMLEEDLKRYLVNRTVWCVENFTKTNISNQAEITSTELTLNLDIKNEGISVKATYPLSFRIRGEDYFHLGEFIFFYETAFKQFLDAAVIYPFQYDYRYVDFDYTPETLLADQFSYGSETESGNCRRDENNKYFICNKNTFADIFSRLGVGMKIRPLPNGDDLFVFTAPGILQHHDTNSDEKYQFRIARQNRAPALDYVERLSCPAAGYDYLVVPGSKDYNYIDINLSAHEPDSDEIVYEFKRLPSEWLPVAEIDEEHLHLGEGNLLAGRYDFEAVSYGKDDKFLSDNQTVRVLVDRPLTMELSLKLPYKGITSQIDDDYYLVSREDPVFLDVTFPQQPLTDDLDDFTLTYFGVEDVFSFNVLPREESRQENSYSTSIVLPQRNGQFQMSEENLQKITDASFLPRPFNEVVRNGKLVLDYTVNYCSRFSLSDQEEITVDVRECVPYQNPSHPYPFIPGTVYYKYEFPLDEEGKTDFAAEHTINPDFNPFLASHNCCDFLDWSVYPADKKCFTNPLPDCYGKVKDYTALSGFGGYVLETQTKLCDGIRGNICNGGWNYELLKEGGREQLICGDSILPACKNDIKPKCAYQDAYGYITLEDSTKGWCYGTMGCTDFCTEPVVDERPTAIVGGNINLNQLALNSEPKPLSSSELGFGCGCNRQNLDKPCDADYNHRFNGRCGSGPENYNCRGDS